MIHNEYVYCYKNNTSWSILSTVWPDQHRLSERKKKKKNKASKCKPCVRHKTEVLYDSPGEKKSSFSLINSGADNISSSHCLKENSNTDT